MPRRAAIEREINGRSAEERLAVRRERTAPLVSEFEVWMRNERGKLSRHSEVAKAMDYMLKRWTAFTRFLVVGVAEALAAPETRLDLVV